jgi:hypothetical protein
MLATLSAHSEVISMLLEAGADLEAVDKVCVAVFVAVCATTVLLLYVRC